jgi:hypothetical protein
MKKIIHAILLLFLAGTLQACALAAVAPLIGTAYMGYTTWKGNKAVKYYSEDLETVNEAVTRTYTQMKLKVDIKDSVPKKKYSLETKGNYPMSIDSEAVEANVTKITIDIGFTGDKQFGDFFYKTIDENIARKKAETAKKEPVREAPKAAPKEVAKEPSKEPLKETTKEATQEAVKTAPIEPVAETPKATPKEPVVEAPKTAPKEPAVEAPKTIPKEPVVETPKTTPKELATEAAKEVPKETVAEAPKTTPKEPPKEALLETPKQPAEPAK